MLIIAKTVQIKSKWDSLSSWPIKQISKFILILGVQGPFQNYAWDGETDLRPEFCAENTHQTGANDTEMSEWMKPSVIV